MGVKRIALRVCLLAGVLLALPAAADVYEAFARPPEEAKLQVWYHWLGDYVTEAGLVRDFRTMGDLGVGRAYVFCASAGGLPPANAPALGDEWWRLMGVAIREAKKNGLTLGFHNCPGWSSSGGPWITPENSMKCVVFSETEFTAGANGAASATLPAPVTRCGLYGDIAAYAFPVAPTPVRTGTPFPHTFAVKRTGASEALEFTYRAAFTPRYLLFRTAHPVANARITLAAFVGGSWTNVAAGAYAYGNRTTDDRVLAVALPAPAARYRLTVTSTPPEPWVRPADVTVTDLRLSVQSHVVDILRKNSSGDAYGYVRPSDPKETGLDPQTVRDVSRHLAPNGAFAAPAGTFAPGRWRIVRIGYTSTGKGPHPTSVKGLECDKLDRRGVEAHWRAYPAKILALPEAKDVIRSVVIDSYEVGGQNWTVLLPRAFAQRRGYPLGAHLLSVCGYTLGTAEETAKFLWDFQRTIGELFAENYYDRFAELARASGLECVFESYGGPFDGVRCAKNADVPTGEFWLGRPPHASLKLMRTVAHDYGKRIIAAESFTTEFAEGRFRATPRIFRAAGEGTGWINGVNSIVLHSFYHQPFTHVKPGLSMDRHGSHFGANTPWIGEARHWSDYIRRGQALLQYGKPGFADLDGVPDPVCPKGLRTIRREGEKGERVYFVFNGNATPFFGTVGLPAPAGSAPEIFDAVTGAITPAAVRNGKGVAHVQVDLPPERGTFVVFSPKAIRTGEAPVATRPAETVLADLSRDWTIVAFDGLAAPKAPVRLAELVSWSRSDDPALRHFTGHAVYEKTVDVPEPCVLDLGEVRDVATVWVDGVEKACLWDAPYRVTVPAGRHTLRVDTVNAWPNRMIGDAIARKAGAAETTDPKLRVPAWVAQGKPDSGTGIFTWCNWPKAWAAEDALQPAGLIGPVRLIRTGAAVQETVVASASLHLGLDGRGRIRTLQTQRGGIGLANGDAPQSLFTLEALRTNDFSVTQKLDAAQARTVSIVRVPDGVDVTFSGFPTNAPADAVTCRIRGRADDARLRFGLTAHLCDGWAVTHTAYPRLMVRPKIGARSDDDAFASGANANRLWRDPTDPKYTRWFRGRFPYHAATQFVTFYDDRAGMVFAAEDADGLPKEFGYDRNERGFRLWLASETFATGVASRPYEVTLTGLTGTQAEPLSWHDAADVYRAWASGRKWCATSAADRADLPAWMRDAPAMTMFKTPWFEHPERIHRWINGYWTKRFAGVPLLASMWGWEGRGDWVGTDYFPCRPSDAGFTAITADMRAHGIHPYPWPSGYFWTLTYDRRPDGTFAFDDRARFDRIGKGHVVCDSDGQVRQTALSWLRGGKAVELCGGDPWTISWVSANIVRELAKRGCDVVQGDQLNGGMFADCWCAHHPHAPGTGKWKVDAARAQLAVARAAIVAEHPEGGVVTYEEANETLDDISGVQLVRVGARHPEAEKANLYAYVNHGAIPMFLANPGRDNDDLRAYGVAAGLMPRFVPDVSELGGPVLPPDFFASAREVETTGTNRFHYGENAIGSDSVFRPGRRYRLSADFETLKRGPKARLSLDWGLYTGVLKSLGGGHIRFPEPGTGVTRLSADFTVREGVASIFRVMLNAYGDAHGKVGNLRLEIVEPDGSVRLARYEGDPCYDGYMRRWVALYRGEGRAFLAHGRAAKPPRLTCARQEASDSAPGQPAVYAGAFTTWDGTRKALVLANATRRPQRVSWFDGIERIRTLAPLEILFLPE